MSLLQNPKPKRFSDSSSLNICLRYFAFRGFKLTKFVYEVHTQKSLASYLPRQAGENLPLLLKGVTTMNCDKA